MVGVFTWFCSSVWLCVCVLLIAIIVLLLSYILCGEAEFRVCVYMAFPVNMFFFTSIYKNIDQYLYVICVCVMNVVITDIVLMQFFMRYNNLIKTQSENDNPGFPSRDLRPLWFNDCVVKIYPDNTLYRTVFIPYTTLDVYHGGISVNKSIQFNQIIKYYIIHFAYFVSVKLMAKKAARN